MRRGVRHVLQLRFVLRAALVEGFQAAELVREWVQIRVGGDVGQAC